MSKVDFDISNYSTEELINIIGLGGQLPLDDNTIVQRINELNEQFENKFKKDEYIIQICQILNKAVGSTQDFEDEYKKLKNFYFGYTENNSFKSWNEWSSTYMIEFKKILKKNMLNNGYFNEYISEELNNFSYYDTIYQEALDEAYDAKEMYLIFFDEISNKLKKYKKEEFDQDYYDEDEGKDFLEGGIMDDNETILENYKKFQRENTKTVKKIINIDSHFRTIPDGVICPFCPDILEFYQNIYNGNATNVVVSSNSDGKKLIAGVKGGDLYKLDIDLSSNMGLVPAWYDISLNDSAGIFSKNWVDITMNYNGNTIAVCSEESYIWYSLNNGFNNTWEKSIIDASSTEISGNWTSLTSDFTGENLFVSRLSWVSGNDSQKQAGINYSNNRGTTWSNIIGVISDPNDIQGYTYDMSQNWKDIEITGNSEKVYAIYERLNKYYIIKSENLGSTWTVLNTDKWDYTSNTELIDYKWCKIVTNMHGNKVYIIAENHEYVWRSFDSGQNWSKIDIIGDWDSITCSLDGLQVSVWDKTQRYLIYSKDGGTSWNKPQSAADIANPDNNAKIILSDDGDKILGLDYNGNIFTSKKCKKIDNELFDRPSNFTLDLTEPIRNVSSLKLKNIELPHAWYVFSKNEGTNFFFVKKIGEEMEKIEIPEGTYHYDDSYGTESNIIKQLNDACTAKNINISFNYIGYQNKISIRNNTNKAITIFWYNENDEAQNICGFSGSGPKLNYNLGWLLGFRKTLNVLKENSDNLRGDSQLDIKGTKYVYVSLDEFTNNRAPENVITFENNSATFHMPSYYVKTTMSDDALNGKVLETMNCYVKEDEPVKSCGKKRANPELLSNLTSAQRYTIENIRNTLVTSQLRQYESPQISNLLHKIPLKLSPTLPIIERYTEYGGDSNIEKRFYSGPITLRKFKVRLLNERGNEIDMNETNWSFSLEIEQLTTSSDFFQTIELIKPQEYSE